MGWVGEGGDIEDVGKFIWKIVNKVRNECGGTTWIRVSFNVKLSYDTDCTPMVFGF